MSPLLTSAADLVALIAGYWGVDRLLRGDQLLGTLERLGLRRSAATLLLAASCCVLSYFWSWQTVPQGDLLRAFATALVVMLSWKAATKDIDVVSGEAHVGFRLLLVGAAVGAYVSPAFLVVTTLLLNSPFGLWEHHSTLPMRVLQALLAFLLLAVPLATTGLLQDTSMLLFFTVLIVVSHYVITALAKMLLGPKWWSWMLDNRLHHIAASAYSWGWMRWLPWPRWLRVVNAIKAVEKPMQVGTFAIELLAPLALLHPSVAAVGCMVWSCFHLGVFAASGLLFWDWILTDLLVAGLIVALPASVTTKAFGVVPLVAGCVLLVLFPLRHKLWKPMPLGWFDSPFTQRIHWQVRGFSGKTYGLYNSFMCPHERLYGKVHGCFLAPVPVVTYHLGEVWKPDLRDAIRQAGPDLVQLEEVRRQYGISPKNAEMTARHTAYLQRFFALLNQGARKHVLPRWLRWLKAPGDQIYYWGDLPAYQGQEPVTEVTLHYREEYFDGRELHRLHDEQVLAVEIDASNIPEPVAELTPKQMDDYLLQLAAGRLIDLPGFRKSYVKADDGKPSTAG